MSTLRALLVMVIGVASASSQPTEAAAPLKTEWAAAERASEADPTRPPTPRLELTEVERKKGVEFPGHPSTATLLIYDVTAKGLPSDQAYTLWGWMVGKEPRPEVGGLAVNESGKVVCATASNPPATVQDVRNCDPTEAFQVAVDAAKGEPKRFALISDDGKTKAFAKIIPFPMESTNGPCHLSIELVGPQMFRIRGEGFNPNEELQVTDQSERETARIKMKATADGRIGSLLLPAVAGKDSGSASWTVHGKSCDVALNYKWGRTALELQ